MQVKDIMTENPQSTTPEMNLVHVAKLMQECDCGAIPVVQDDKARKPVGVITDRDIVVRAVAEGKNPSQTKVKESMTKEAVTIYPDETLERCAALMKEKKVRRLIVVDGSGKLIGMVVQAQLATHAPKEVTGQMVQEISQPAPELVPE
jgi:CBS domain-containing protein